MNTLKAKTDGWLTQNTEMPIEDRGFFKEVTGISATYEYFRDATKEEVEEWEYYKKKQAEIWEQDQ